MKYMLPLALLAYVLLASPAQADTPEPFFVSDVEAYCQSLASMATTTANARLDGLSLKEAHDVIDSVPGPADQAQDLKYVADYVFTYPHNSPSAEGNQIYDICKNGW